MATAAAVSVLLCALLILMFYHPGIDKTSAPADRDLATILFISLASLQALVFCLWCLSSCGQAISSERALKTFDFLRTTRLTSWELLVGMVFGAPLMAYFTLACTLPFTLVLGLYAGFPLLALAATYLMLLLLAVVLSLAALAIAAAGALRDLGAIVTTVICAIDRSSPGAGGLSAAGIAVRPVLTKDQLDHARS